MSNRRQRQKKRARKSQQDRQSRQEADAVPDFELELTESVRLLQSYMESSNSMEEVSASARADLLAAAADIVRYSCGLDVIKVVSAVRISMMMEQARTGTEPSAAGLEIIAIVLAHRDATAESVPEHDESAFTPQSVEEAARHALRAGRMIPFFDSPPTDPESNILLRSIEREILIRNASYPHMLIETLRGLFDDPYVHADCQASLGFTGLATVEVLESVRAMSIKELSRRWSRFQDAADDAMPFIEEFSQRPSETADSSAGAEQSTAFELFEALQNLTTSISKATTVDPSATAADTGLELQTVEAVLETFTYTGSTDLDAALFRFFRGDNPLRTAPLVADPSGNRMLVHDALALPAAREVIETRLKATNCHSRYDRHRGTWVEDAAIDLLAGAFTGATVYRGFNYFIPDPDAKNPQTTLASYTKRVEGDGLLLIDDVALIIEVKAVAMTAKARGGVAARLRGKLRDIVTNAAEQAERLRERILTDHRIRLDHGQWIDVSGVREVHTIAVGLEDLTGVTTSTSTLVAAGILKPGSIPWTVSLHDLRVICELVDRPSEALLYLRRRTHPDSTRKFWAVDELDLFMHFLKFGLYVEPDPTEVARTLPWTAPPTEEAIRRFEEQQPEMISTLTAPLDDWYNAQIDPDSPPVQKPGFSTDRKLLALVDQVLATRSPGALSTATSLMEGDAVVQKRFGRNGPELGLRVREDRQPHSATHFMSETSGRHILLVWACRGLGQDVEAAAAHLEGYLRAKKHQTGAYRATCMLFNPNGKTLLRLIFDNGPNADDPGLDAAASLLVPLERMAANAPKPVRFMRGDRGPRSSDGV